MGVDERFPHTAAIKFSDGTSLSKFVQGGIVLEGMIFLLNLRGDS